MSAYLLLRDDCPYCASLGSVFGRSYILPGSKHLGLSAWESTKCSNCTVSYDDREKASLIIPNIACEESHGNSYSLMSEYTRDNTQETQYIIYENINTLAKDTLS